MCYCVVLFEYAFFDNKVGFLEEIGTFENFTYFAWFLTMTEIEILIRKNSKCIQKYIQSKEILQEIG